MTCYLHPNSLCETTNIGDGTRVWAFAHILPGARIGEHCNICDGVFIENDVIIGARVTIKCGVQIWDGIRIDDDVFIGPNATFANDAFPRSKQYQEQVPETFIGKGVSIGANSTILPGLRIGRHAMIGAGSVVTADVPAYAKVIGNPARIAGYVNASTQLAPHPARETAFLDEAVADTAVAGVTIHRLHTVEDLRGTLSVAEFDKDIPFVAKRQYVVYAVPGKYVRGERALRNCKQFLICVAGSLSLVVDDGRSREDIVLDRPDLGVYVPPMVWTVQYRHSPDSVLLVLASEPYDPADYIRDYDDFLALVHPDSGA